jgi:hypothetical protein
MVIEALKAARDFIENDRQVLAESLTKTCTASQLVARLQELIARHGDLPVYARDADTRWRLPIGLMFREAQPEEERPARFEVCTDYHDRPRGDFEQA